MIVAMDTNVLLLLMRPDAGIPVDPTTGQPIVRAGDRIALLVERLVERRAQIVIPTPVLSELLVGAGDQGPAILNRFQKDSVWRLAPFDTLAAVELAARTRDDAARGDKHGGSTGLRQKVKIDRQIVAIAAVEGASVIYTNDKGLRLFAEAQGIEVQGVHDLPLPEPDLLSPLGL